MGDYDTTATVPGMTPVAGSVIPGVRWTGGWAGPVGWQGRWMWQGTVTHYAPQAYTIETRRGKPQRVAIPAAKQRPRSTPDLVFVESFSEYQRRLAPEKGQGPPWVDAKDMPYELREMIVDTFGEENLNATQQAICAPVLRARAEARAERARRAPEPEPARKVATKTKARAKR